MRRLIARLFGLHRLRSPVVTVRHPDLEPAEDAFIDLIKSNDPDAMKRLAIRMSCCRVQHLDL